MPMRHKNSRPATQQGGNITEYFVFFYCLLDRGHFRGQLDCFLFFLPEIVGFQDQVVDADEFLDFLGQGGLLGFVQGCRRSGFVQGQQLFAGGGVSALGGDPAAVGEGDEAGVVRVEGILA